MHETCKYEKNAVICLQGETADRLFVLRRGRVGVYINLDEAAPQEEQVLSEGVRVGALDREGNFIGEGGLFLEKRGASLVALTDGTTVEHIPLEQSGLKQVMTEQPSIGMKLCRSLAEHLRDVTERVKEISTVAESVSRATDQLAVAYSDLMREVERMAESVPALQPVADCHAESPLRLKGNVLLEHRRETTVFFVQAARQQRSGTLNLEPGQMLCEEGKMGRALYLVRQGELEVLAGTVKVGRIGPSEIVGEIAVLMKELPKRSATVRAATPAMLNCIPAVKFHALAADKPEILVLIARTLANRLDTTNHLVCQRSRSSVDILDALAGNPASCEQQFNVLADELESHPEADGPMRKARAYAGKALRTRRELEASCRSLLGPLAPPATPTPD